MNIFNQVIEAHAAWTRELLNVCLHQAQIGLEVKQIVDSHLSDMGQWIEEVGTHYHYLPSIGFVHYEHEKFKNIAGELSNFLSVGREELAREMLRSGGAFRQCSNMIVAALLECSRELNAPALKAIPAENTVSEILSGKAIKFVIKVDSDSSVVDAINIMAKHNVGSLAVYAKDEFVGMFTERGYLRNIAIKGLNSLDLPIASMIDINTMSVQPEHGIEHCILLMTSTRTRHLPVMRDGSLIGIISIGDILKKVVRYCA